MSTDFFDEDLTATEAGAADKPAAAEPAPRPAAEPVGGRLARHKEELGGQVAGAANEIERLKQRQLELEREKANLENLSRKQEEYEKGKQEIIEKLDRSLLLLEKEEVQTARMAELLASMRARFKELLDELRAIDEERWPDDAFGAELSKALALVEDARMTYKKGLAKIEATRWPEGGGAQVSVATADALPPPAASEPGFGYWLKAGLAFTLPLAAVLIALYVLHLALTGG